MFVYSFCFMRANYYFIDKTNKQVGPLSLEELKQRNISPKTFVWSEGMPNWLPAKDIPELHEYVMKNKPQINTVRIILIVYATLGSIVFLLMSRFISAFIASQFDTYPYIPSIVTLIIGVVVLVFFLFFKKRKYLLNAALVILPILISSLFPIFYYFILNHSYPFRSERCIMEKQSGTGVMNKFGLEIIPYIYDNVIPNNIWAINYYYAVYKNKKGVLSPKGEEIIPCIYTDIDTWHTTNNFIVKSGKLKGLYSPEGKEIVPCLYTKISYWKETTLLHVQIDDKEGLYTLDGEEILPCQFIICKQLNGISLINRGGHLEDGNIRGGIWGVIDKEGKTIVPCKYSDIIPYAASERIEANGEYITDIYDFNGNYLRSEYKW